MANRRNFISVAKFLIMISFGGFFTHCGGKPETVIAIVNDTSISLETFKSRYQDFLNTTHFKDNLRYRQIYLQSLIDEQLIVNYAVNSGLMDTPRHIRSLKDIADQILLNTLYNLEVQPKLNVTEEELRLLYKWSKTALHVRHLFARTRIQIDSIYQELQSGTSWEDMARLTFKDSVLAANGGDLGFVELGDLDPAFEQTAYRLDDGEISAPVQTEYGYSIIQVVEREYDPFLLEDEYQQQKNWLKLIAANYKKRPLVKAFTDSIAAALEIQFHPEGITALTNQLLEANTYTEEFNIREAEIPCLTIVSTGEVWSVAESLSQIQTLSNRQLSHLNKPGNITTVLTGLVIRNHLLKRARRQKLDQSPDYRNELTVLRNNYIVKQVMKTIYNQIKVPEAGNEAIIRRDAFIAFRDSLKSMADIAIDSSVIRSFLLKDPV